MAARGDPRRHRLCRLQFAQGRGRGLGQSLEESAREEREGRWRSQCADEAKAEVPEGDSEGIRERIPEGA